MTAIKEIITLLDHNYLDLLSAFRGLAEKNLHKRPAPKTLAISEIAAHIAHCEAHGTFKILLGIVRKDWPVASPFFHSGYTYTPNIYNDPIRPAVRAMDVSAARDELFRVHEAVIARLKNVDVDLDSKLPGAWGKGGTVRNHLSYLVYHVAYHTGQIYLTRHILRERTLGQ